MAVAVCAGLWIVAEPWAIVASRGQTYTLGEAYAFGVIWSFAFKSLAVMVLRFTRRAPREWKVPFNIPLGPYELPLGLAAITLAFAVVWWFAAANRRIPWRRS